ncbi:MAG TPA: DivIVA domain-containing protein [Acidimicrobiales bacterium]|jgi:DivIVA domain-containing protein|nr:DivIVA domain-containing protein [Acidimicrobiales bacterium]
MPEDHRLSISSSSSLSPDEVARHTFGTVRRGFDPGEVRTYLDYVADALRVAAEREIELRHQVAEAEHRAANPVLDEGTLTSALGQETARVLQSAHDASHDMVTKAEAGAARLLTEAQDEIARAEGRAEQALAERTAQAEASVTEYRQRTHDEAEAMMAQARSECREMIEEAQALRSRVLADLSKRRKVLHAQIEQLRAGREHLAETVRGVRRTVDGIADELFRAEDEARLAAEAAGREAIARPYQGTPEEEAAMLLAEGAGGPGLADLETVVEDPPSFGSDPAEAGEPLAPEQEAFIAAEIGVSEIVAEPEEFTAGETGEHQAGAHEIALETEPTAETEPIPGVGEEAAPDSDGLPGEDVGQTGDEQVGLVEAETIAVPAPSVDELFAKLRAEQGTDHGDEAGSGTEGEASATEAVGSPPEDPLVARRDELVGPVITALSRRLKRTLQDDQNDLLDRLRNNGSTWSVELLPDEVEHLDGYATAALPQLEQAANAGRLFVGDESTGGPLSEHVVGVAHDLATAIVGPLRRRLIDDGLSSADESAVAEQVGAAFREWKGERIERLAGDYVIAGFSAGSVAGSSQDIEWIAAAAPGSTPCPDCDDNALNGPQQAGQEFPTGHRHPPAHSGCRCLLAPSAT